MATASKVAVIPCGAMTADLTWLLIKPGLSIADRHHKDSPPQWVDVPTHCVLVETDELSEQTGAQMIFGHDAQQIHQLRVGPKDSYT